MEAGAEFVKYCSSPPLQLSRSLISIASSAWLVRGHDSLRALRAATGISYDERTRGTLQLFRTQKQFDASAGDIAVPPEQRRIGIGRMLGHEPLGQVARAMSHRLAITDLLGDGSICLGQLQCRPTQRLNCGHRVSRSGIRDVHGVQPTSRGEEIAA